MSFPFVTKSTLLHLRIPFSYYLMPVFLFAMSQVPETELFQAGYVVPADYYFQAGALFLVLHLFLYPASNGFNSYYDRDKGSIGGLKDPPPVNRELLNLSFLFDGSAILISYLFVSTGTALMVLVYGLVSKAYSHPRIRLKKYPVLGLLTICIFQGAFIYGMVYFSLTGSAFEWSSSVWGPALISSLFLAGLYPMTQVYQHQEDQQRGDRTLSIVLGVKGTFIWAACFFIIALGGFFLYFYPDQLMPEFVLLMILVAPTAIYFIHWWTQVVRDPGRADYKGTMRLNWISSSCLSAYFLILFMMNGG